MVKSLTAASKAEPKEVVVTEQDANALALAAEAELFDTGASTGFENVTAKDLLIPRITILQGLSPQVTRGKPEFNPDLRPGMIYDVGLTEVFEEAIHVIPVHFFKQWLEWAPRNTGKGLVAVHDNGSILDQTEKDAKNKDVLPNGNYVSETAQFYVLNLSARNRKSFIAMTSTQLKKSRSWLTRAQNVMIPRADGTEFQAPLFYHSYILSTVPESNAEGAWDGWKIETGPKLTELDNWKHIHKLILEFRESIDKGEVQSDKSSLEDEVSGGRGGGGRSEGQADTGQAM